MNMARITRRKVLGLRTIRPSVSGFASGLPGIILGILIIRPAISLITQEIPEVKTNTKERKEKNRKTRSKAREITNNT